MMKKILVPVDFSDCSKLAANYASGIARKTSGEIYLLHVLDTAEPDMSLGSTGSWAGSEDVSTVPYMIGRLKRVKTQMQQFITEMNLSGLKVKDAVEVGEPYMKINEAAEKYEADLIAMGTHGVSGMQALLVGSVAEKVVQHANRPVLSIREKSQIPPVNIIFASDFSEEAGRVFDSVKKFASVFGATIHLLNVTDRDDETTNEESRLRLRAFAMMHHIEDYPFRIFPAATTEEGVLLFSKEIKADLIAIGTHGRRGLARFFIGSVSEELVNHSFCPVLTVNFKEKK
jgi:nucleotide-binding universal stress UspA family protein